MESAPSNLLFLCSLSAQFLPASSRRGAASGSLVLVDTGRGHLHPGRQVCSHRPPLGCEHQSHGHQVTGLLELSMVLREISQCPVKDPSKTFSLLSTPTNTFTIDNLSLKTLLSYLPLFSVQHQQGVPGHRGEPVRGRVPRLHHGGRGPGAGQRGDQERGPGHPGQLQQGRQGERG